MRAAYPPSCQRRWIEFLKVEHSLLRQLCYDTLRQLPRLQLQAQALIPKKLKRKDSDVQALVLLGLYQLGYSRIPAHAAISETVKAAGRLKKPWAKGLVNGVLRSHQRRRDVLEESLNQQPVYRLNHPAWLVDMLFKRLA